MDDERRRKELSDFLKTRRLRLSPKDAGLQAETARRRTPGLRREEVASLSGISLPWYTALEQGRDIRVSEQILDSLARTFKLNEDENIHLRRLANPYAAANRARTEFEVTPALQQILDRMGTYPAYVTDRRWNVMAWNQAAAAIFGDFSRAEEPERHILWRIFMQPDMRSGIVNWEDVASMLLAQFRSRYALYMNDPWYPQFVSQLCDASSEFKDRWEKHEVSGETEGRKLLLHPKVGLLTFAHHTFAISENQECGMTVYTPVEQTETEERMRQLLRDPLSES
ncbi:helix-turn-helix transcriptional regulator [Cohnella zeiphila]|uniref:Helix-turn-helix domain-containing protein n=1 Tax=Cohnella zeiphila TaxID=2761120 RepID=A0A7X0VZL7_9BACL|nr:helix-turn-helix transcriptional regulator [Cohnella zeiphila]MBB6735895.1 helix-turn-helix domain-containing protein [Cohnella zeiphila]